MELASAWLTVCLLWSTVMYPLPVVFFKNVLKGVICSVKQVFLWGNCAFCIKTDWIYIWWYYYALEGIFMRVREYRTSCSTVAFSKLPQKSLFLLYSNLLPHYQTYFSQQMNLKGMICSSSTPLVYLGFSEILAERFPEYAGNLKKNMNRISGSLVILGKFP